MINTLLNGKRNIVRGIAAGLLLMAGTSAHAQTVFLNEDFATGTGSTAPTGWSQNVIAGNPSFDLWRFNNPGGRTLNTPITAPAGIFDSDNFSNDGNPENVALESPAFNTTGYFNIVLKWDQSFNGGFGGGATVEVFNGTSWVSVYSTSLTTPNPDAQSIDISAQASNRTGVKVRFRWTGDYSWWWIVDNINVYAPNTVPSFTGGATQSLTLCQNAAATSINSLLAVSDTDPGQTETWSVTTAATHGTVVATYSVTSTGSTLTPTGLTYTPTTGYSGTDMFVVGVNDGHGGTASTTINVTVNALPTVHNVTGGGPYCTGGLGVHIGMDNSESGNTYQLYMGGTLMGIRPGTGGTVDFGSLLSAGTYTVLATSPASCDNNMAGSATISILPLVTPSVSVATTPGDTVCAGTSTTFTATPVNGGTTPAYEWKVNGTTVATTTAAHVYAPADGDVVTVIMTSSEACPSPATASASQTMVVVSNETPVVSIAVGPNDTLCQGSYASFTAGAAFGGTAPVFTWYKNGVSTTITGGTYTYIPVNGDIISAKLNSNYRCPIVNNVASNNIPMHVDSVYIPIIVINTNTGLTVKTGTSVTFTATILKGDPTSQYQWYRNTSMLVGATNATYTSSSLVNGDSISCWVQGIKDCSYYSYNSVKMKIHNEVATVGTEADIKLVPNPNNGEFTLSGTMPSAGNSEVALEVVNMIGQVVYKGTTTPSGGNIDAHIRLGNSLSNGMYILTVHSGTDSKTFRFVVRQ